MEINTEKAVNDSDLSRNFRFERKYIFENSTVNDLVHKIYKNSYCFTEIFEQRNVNNIYFDDFNFSFYHQNVSGVANRKKIRLRWYGNQFNIIENPVFEIKIKKGEVGDKISHKLNDFCIDLNTVSIKELHKLLYVKILNQNTFLKATFNLIRPSLYNSYSRRYFLSNCKKFRITIDFNQTFFNPNYKNYKKSKRTITNEIVLELKYNLEHDDEARVVSQELLERLSKNSKYVNGIDLIS